MLACHVNFNKCNVGAYFIRGLSNADMNFVEQSEKIIRSMQEIVRKPLGNEKDDERKGMGFCGGDLRIPSKIVRDTCLIMGLNSMSTLKKADNPLLVNRFELFLKRYNPNYGNISFEKFDNSCNEYLEDIRIAIATEGQ
jgi:hypothetical protein